MSEQDLSSVTSRIIMLDTGPLGMVTNPKTSSAICQECKLWLDYLPLKGYKVMLPEIADYRRYYS